MGAKLQAAREHWNNLGSDAPVRFSPLLACAMVLYSAGASIFWYAIKGGSIAQALAGAGLNRTRLVIAFVWLGIALFYALLWVLRKVPPSRISWRTHVVILGAALLLSLFWFYGRRGSFQYWFGFYPPWGGHRGMWPYYFFVSCSVLARILVPLLLISWVLRRSPSAFGFQLKNVTRGWWVYAVLVLGVVLVVIFYASTLPAFLRKYPWCKQGIINGSLNLDLLLIYLSVSFVFYFSGEAFWRGFLLFGTVGELGKNGLSLMIMPYVLGHLGKPLPETLGALGAGLVLGTLAWHHRSFILGAVSHWLVATAMDLSALYRRGVDIIW